MFVNFSNYSQAKLSQRIKFRRDLSFSILHFEINHFFGQKPDNSLSSLELTNIFRTAHLLVSENIYLNSKGVNLIRKSDFHL